MAKTHLSRSRKVAVDVIDLADALLDVFDAVRRGRIHRCFWQVAGIHLSGKNSIAYFIHAIYLTLKTCAQAEMGMRRRGVALLWFNTH